MRSSRWRREATALERTRREREGEGERGEEMREYVISPSRFFIRWMENCGSGVTFLPSARTCIRTPYLYMLGRFLFSNDQVYRVQAECMPDLYHH